MLAGAACGASGRQGASRPGKAQMEDAHVLAALRPCAMMAPGAGEAAHQVGGRDPNIGGGGGGGGVALARLGARAGLRVPLSPAAALAAAMDGGGGAAPSASSAPHLLLAGVFDGHAGPGTSRQAALHLPRLVHAALVREQDAALLRAARRGAQQRQQQEQRQLCLPSAAAAAAAAEGALALAFPAFDRWWRDARCDPSLTRHGWDDSGSTAVVALLAGDRLVVANAGDSVALLVRPGGATTAGSGGGGGDAQDPAACAFVTRLTVEHNAENEQEAARVVGAGGRILTRLGPPGGGGGGGARLPSGAASPSASPSPSAPARTRYPRPRVSGASPSTRHRSAAVTRALGDFAFKLPHPLLTPEPHVSSRVLSRGDDLVLLCSDGVTDALSDAAAAEVALAAARRERRRLEAALGARSLLGARGGGPGPASAAAAAGLAGSDWGALSRLPDPELRRALRQAVARAAADAVVREAHARGSGDDATCVAVFLDWHEAAAEGGAGGRVGGGAVFLDWHEAAAAAAAEGWAGGQVGGEAVVLPGGY